MLVLASGCSDGDLSTPDVDGALERINGQAVEAHMRKLAGDEFQGRGTGSAGYLMAAEYVASRGNTRIILCERGIRTFETATRNTLDLAAVCILQRESHLPVIVDPSHATGVRELVAPMARAALAAGADGVMVEVHAAPSEALSDGPQALTPGDFAQLAAELTSLEAALAAVR